MGMFMSFLGKGGASPTSQIVGQLMGTVFKEFVEKDIQNFEEFHIAVLDIFNTVNGALPGKHMDGPPTAKVEEYYRQWKGADEIMKKIIFVNFLKDNIIVSKLDDYTLITGVLTPPAALAAKRAGENVPQLNIIKAIPDVVFVPSATLLALMIAKLSRGIMKG